MMQLIEYSNVVRQCSGGHNFRLDEYTARFVSTSSTEAIEQPASERT